MVFGAAVLVSSVAGAQATTQAPAPQATTQAQQPAPRHHSKLKGALVGGAGGAMVGGKKGAIVGAAGGAIYQHHKNKKARRQMQKGY